MDIQNPKTKTLLPSWMQQDGDGAIDGMSDGVDEIVKIIAKDSELLHKWDELDKMTDEQLDALAWELNIPWYISSADIDAKRRIIESSDLVHSKLGTKSAVERIIKDYFLDGEVREWEDYNGDPYHFKVWSPNPSTVWHNFETFLYLLQFVKRKSAWLDAIVMGLTAKGTVYIGTANREHSHEIVVCHPDAIHLYAGIMNHDKTRETVTIGIDGLTINVDSSDATATAADILEGKTAYAKGAKITGTMAPVDDDYEISSVAEIATIAEGYHDGTGTVKLSDAAKEPVKSENIKAGVNILGIDGSYSGETTKAQDVDYTPTNAASVIKPADGYDYMGKVTIEPIPYKEIENDKGTTVIIGDDPEEEG